MDERIEKIFVEYKKIWPYMALNYNKQKSLKIRKIQTMMKRRLNSLGSIEDNKMATLELSLMRPDHKNGHHRRVSTLDEDAY